MDAALLAAKSNYGYGKAATYLGQQVQQFRPTTATGPVSGTPVATLFAYFDQSPQVNFKRDWDRKKPEGYACIDATNLAVGDYLVGLDTYFTTRIEGGRAPGVVLCNHVLSVIAPASSTVTDRGPVGAGAYDGPTEATEQASVLASGWPASVLQGTKGETDPAKLPSDVRAPWWAILLPAIPGVTITRETTLTDENEVDYQVSSAELTSWGWRLTASQDAT